MAGVKPKLWRPSVQKGTLEQRSAWRVVDPCRLPERHYSRAVSALSGAGAVSVGTRRPEKKLSGMFRPRAVEANLTPSRPFAMQFDPDRITGTFDIDRPDGADQRVFEDSARRLRRSPKA